MFHAWAERFETACNNAASEPTDAAPTDKRRFPAVPDDEIPYFRAACRDALTKPDFRIVDAAYRKAFDSAYRWLQARPDVNEDEAGAFLASQVRWVPDVNEQLTRLRGAQVAFLRHWWLLKVDPEALAAAHDVDPLVDLADDAVYDRLRKYAHPKTGALAALSIATRLSPGRLSMLNADQVFIERPTSLSSSYNLIDLGDEIRSIPAAACSCGPTTSTDTCATSPLTARSSRRVPASAWAQLMCSSSYEPSRATSAFRSLPVGQHQVTSLVLV